MSRPRTGQVTGFSIFRKQPKNMFLALSAATGDGAPPWAACDPAVVVVRPPTTT
jgi:hypothetical protein